MWQLRPGILSRAAIDAAAGPGAPTYENMVWNSADKAAGITLFDADKEAWHATLTSEWVRATKAISTGKYCWALHVDGSHIWRAGIATAAFDLNGGTLGAGTISVSISNLGVVQFNGVTLADYTDFAQGDYVLIAFDADAGDIWFGMNTTWNGDPGAGTGAVKSDVAAGTWYPAFGTTGTGPLAKVTLVPFPTTIPTGFMPLQPAPSVDNKHWEVVHFVVVTSFVTTLNGVNLRQVLTAAQLLDKTSSKVRMRLKASSSGAENMQIDAAYFGHQAGAGDVWDFDGTQVALNVGGTNAFTVPWGTIVTSDETTYSFDGSKGLVFSFHFNNGSHDNAGQIPSLTGYNAYTKTTAVGDTGTADVTGYANVANVLRIVQEVQVYVDD